MNLAEGKLFVRNAANIISVFGEEAFGKALETFECKDFGTFEFVPLDQASRIHFMEYKYPVAEDVVDHYVEEFLEYKGAAWSRHVWKKCRKFLVPDSYQFNEEKLIRSILEARFPYFKFFDWRIYHLDRPDDDIYLQCESGSLYVPVKAIVAGSWKMILDRHISYHAGYFKGADRAEYLAKALAIPESYTARLFKACMETPLEVTKS